jgi:ligand-binding sensor domain-containing protein
MNMKLTQNQLSIIKILFVLLFLHRPFFAQSMHFNKITIKDGLSNSYVNCLLQDQKGFIWIGTDDGLNRFDGYDIKVYRNDLKIKIQFQKILSGQFVKIIQGIYGLALKQEV